MTTLTLRTRTIITAASSSSRSSTYQEDEEGRSPQRVTLRAVRPVFVSSPAPRRSRRAARSRY
jgi:hypothetical protein